MSREATASLEQSARARRSGHRSAHLGSTLRAVMLHPRRGFEEVLAVTERRREEGYRTPEGAAPTVLAALGGAALMTIWLKLGGLLELRTFAQADFRWVYLFVAMAVAAVAGILAQLMWSVIAAKVAQRLGRRADQAELRTVWGAASFPLSFALFPVLALDAILVGPASFTTEQLADPISKGWASVSIAIGAGLVVWFLFLLLRGFSSATGFRTLRAAPALGVAVLSAAGLVVALRGLGMLLGGGA